MSKVGSDERSESQSLERTALDRLREWRRAVIEADANKEDYLEGGETWKRCRAANIALRAAADALLGGEG